MLKPLRSNPLLAQTMHARRWPSPRVTLVLLIALLTGAAAGRAWLIDHTPTEGRAVLLLLLWLLPLVTMAVAAVSTARRLRSESFQLVRQSPLTDRQITWGLDLRTLYTLRVMLVLAFGLLPALVDDTPLGGASTVLCLAGLHLAASMLGTVLVLRWDRKHLGVVMAAICCTAIVAMLPTLSPLLSPILTPGCPSIRLHPVHFRLGFLLLRWGLRGLPAVVIVAVLPIPLGWAASLIPWRGRAEGWHSLLEAMGLVVAAGLALGLWVIDASQVEARERQALVALHQATNGENWRFSLGWLSDQPACSWFGVLCTCDRVVELSLFDNNLQGTLPPEIGQLTNLQELALYNNYLTDLPPEFGQLTSLQKLLLRGNQLTTLPPEFGQLTSLKNLELSENQLTELPPEIGQLTSLVVLNLGENQLTTLPPEIGQLTRLTSLHLGGNQLTVLPPEIGQLTSLEYLDVSGNHLTELPLEICQLPNLQVIEPPELCNH